MTACYATSESVKVVATKLYLTTWGRNAIAERPSCLPLEQAVGSHLAPAVEATTP